MPVLIVYGVPDNTEENTFLPTMILALRDEVATLLKIPNHWVSVFFPKDLCPEGLGEEIVVHTIGLVQRPERTVEARNELAKAICGYVVGWMQKGLPQLQMVEVIPEPHPDGGGCARWDRESNEVRIVSTRVS